MGIGIGIFYGVGKGLALRCPIFARRQKELLCMSDLCEELFACRSTEHSDTDGAEVIDALEDGAGCDMSATMQDTSPFVELTDIIVYQLAKDIDVEGLGS